MKRACRERKVERMAACQKKSTRVMCILSYPTLGNSASINPFDYCASPGNTPVSACKHPFNHRSWDEDTAYAVCRVAWPAAIDAQRVVTVTTLAAVRRSPLQTGGWPVAPLYWYLIHVDNSSR